MYGCDSNLVGAQDALRDPNRREAEGAREGHGDRRPRSGDGRRAIDGPSSPRLAVRDSLPVHIPIGWLTGAWRDLPAAAQV